MTVKVADASALVALIFSEPKQSLMESRLAGAELVAPYLLPLEVANACAKKIRARRHERVALLAAYETFGQMNIDLRDIAPAAALAAANAHSISAYDACYLLLARQLGAELVTLDNRLEKAASKR